MAEYRPGFHRCSDCDLELVETLPSTEKANPRSSVNDRPDQAPKPIFLAWFLPMVCFVALYILVAFNPTFLQYRFVALSFVLSILFHNLGAFWMLYQAIRYEKRVVRYVVLSFVPFLFVWYRLVRYPLRRELPRLS